MYNLANIYKEGSEEEGIKKDVNKAIELYKESARLGDSDSMLKLGLIFQRGLKDEGIERDIVNSLLYYKKGQK